MLVDQIKTRLATIPVLTNRVQMAADLTELVRQKAMPQTPVAAFVLPLALNANTPDAIANAFSQMAVETFGILLLVKAAGDATGGRALPSIDSLRDLVIAKMCGWVPPQDNVIQDGFALLRGQLISTEAGTVIYQLDFSIQKQIRVVA